ncbi:hypothetical protein B5X24_HaOG216089 [Helicoverpa armigera]|nr:hypothetical protein B5X24_HaOG216089 [Helicoverpa armigera]
MWPHGDKNGSIWCSRTMSIAALLSQTLGIHTMVFLPHTAVTAGAAGHAIVYSFIFMMIGIPLLYMESVVSQFTGRDCLEIWQARPCFSHVGYLYIVWQVVFGIYLHIVNSFIVHFFLVSFENPIPFHICGSWSKNNCNIMNYNYTVNQDCLKQINAKPYCNNLCETFPEYQYWRYCVLGLDKDYYYLPWRIGLGSGLIVIILFLGCFKGVHSLKWLLLIVTILPVVSRFLFMIGSMLQKGVVVKYEAAIDSDFTDFNHHFSLSNSVAQVLYSINVGTGLAMSTASRTSFRAPCYSNTVIVVIITWCLAILGICSTAMMVCPYAFKYDIEPGTIMRYSMANLFEKIPRLLHSYEQPMFWLILLYGCLSLSTLCLGVCITSGLIQMTAKRYARISRNPGLVALTVSICIYVGTAPFLSNTSLYFLVDTKRTLNALTLFLVLLENIVLILWYGVDKFSEDVHFMQGIQPSIFMKFCWMISPAILAYVFVTQFIMLFYDKHRSIGSLVSWYVILAMILISILWTLIKIFIAIFNNTLYEQVGLDASWGPKSDLLKRSRAMFSAQAMTKEYMYRQYHLQAGILKRQRASNVRCSFPGFSLRSETLKQEVENIEKFN